MIELSKQKLVNYLLSASKNKSLGEYKFRADTPGEEEVRLVDVLELAYETLKQYMPEDIKYPEKSLRDIMRVGVTFKVEKPFVYRKIQFKVDDRIEVTEFNAGNGVGLVHVGADTVEGVVHDVQGDYMDLSEMYNNHFITRTK